MVYDKKKYQELIINSPLFTLRKETESAAYKRESYNLVEHLYCYLMAVNQSKYEPFGCEIVTVAARCIGNYDGTKGVFLHYFNAAWKQEYAHLIGNRIVEEKLRGIRITESDKREIRKLLTLMEKHPSDGTIEERYTRLADAMQLPVEKVRLIAEMSNIRVVGERISNADEMSIWAQIADRTSFEDALEEAESIEDLLTQIETVYMGLQERLKPIVSDMITARIWRMLSAQTDNSKQYRFVSQSILEECLRTNAAPSQRIIADKYGRDRASISRTLKDFLCKLKLQINKA